VAPQLDQRGRRLLDEPAGEQRIGPGAGIEAILASSGQDGLPLALADASVRPGHHHAGYEAEGRDGLDVETVVEEAVDHVLRRVGEGVAKLARGCVSFPGGA
jgi:hypothetical protein